MKSKKQTRKSTTVNTNPSAKRVVSSPAAAADFNYEQMLSELEAIVADAEIRLAEEEAA